MTDIQVKYWTYVEGQRHNVATETQQKNELGESVRHNLTTESQGQQIVNENVRHNKESETIGYLGATAQLQNASAALQNAATNARNADINQQIANQQGWKTMSDIAVNDSKVRLNTQQAIGQSINNYIAGFGKEIKAVNSVYGEVADTALTFAKTGKTFSDSVFGVIGNAMGTGFKGAAMTP